MTYLIGCQCECDMTKFVHSKIVPEIISKVPETPLQVVYKNQSISCESHISRFLTIPAPTLDYPADDNKLYTLIMIDVDAPFPSDPILSPFRHWLVVNIPGNDINKGNTKSVYISPSPPMFGGAHRYILLIYEQTRKLSNISYGEINRIGFDINDFVTSNDLKGPISGNFYYVGSSTEEFLEEALSLLKELFGWK
ncbi:phosphatidylethanolamine-binding protein homolog F40A3.3 [Nephila pilipes]|uniref:Phosphatidylethanolamine-binding protein homolog F40A3.3 n=1 Tax=Nephila pilipes TaxID=299642 RepID=A0A8X6PC65_NEPPI|nr:phosphatidylethanolamine-binding protein homolog F40A3.3 [Nephila pilipes]